MKIYKHAFRGHEPQMDHVVYALAEEPVTAAIMAQAYALRRGLAWKRFKQTVAAHRPHINVEPFAWNDVSFAKGYRPTLHERLDYETRRDIVMGYRQVQVPMKVSIAMEGYRHVDNTTVEFVTAPLAETVAAENMLKEGSCERRHEHPLGRPYTMEDAAQIAWRRASPCQQDLWKDMFLSVLALPSIDPKVRLSVNESIYENGQSVGRARISFGSSMFREVQRHMEAYFNCRGVKFDKISASTYLLRWTDLFKYFGIQQAVAAMKEVAEELGVL